MTHLKISQCGRESAVSCLIPFLTWLSISWNRNGANGGHPNCKICKCFHRFFLLLCPLKRQPFLFRMASSAACQPYPSLSSKCFLDSPFITDSGARVTRSLISWGKVKRKANGGSIICKARRLNFYIFDEYNVMCLYFCQCTNSPIVYMNSRNIRHRRRTLIIHNRSKTVAAVCSVRPNPLSSLLCSRRSPYIHRRRHRRHRRRRRCLLSQLETRPLRRFCPSLSLSLSSAERMSQSTALCFDLLRSQLQMDAMIVCPFK